MPRTYGALGPRGSNADTLIPRPDLAPAPVFVRGGPGPSRQEREGYEASQDRRRARAREGAMFREALKRAMRETHAIDAAASDENKKRDLERYTSMRQATTANQAAQAGIWQTYNQPKMQADALAAQQAHEAMMEQTRQRGQMDVERLRADTEMRKAEGGLPLPESVMGVLGQVAPQLVMALMMPRLRAATKDNPELGPVLDQMGQGYVAGAGREADVQREQAVAPTLDTEPIKAFLEHYSGKAGTPWAQELVGMPAEGTGLFGGLRGAGRGLFGGGGEPHVSVANIDAFLRKIREAAPGARKDPELVYAIAEKLINNPDFYDEFASDIPWSPGNEGELRLELLNQLRANKKSGYFNKIGTFR